MGGSISNESGQSRAYKCVMIGETGSGKTSFLNLIGNLAKVLTLEEAEDLAAVWKLLTHFHQEAKTENIATQGKSQTNRAHAHNVPGLGFDFTIIDTPGFGDTDGLAADQRHLESIQEAIAEQDAINCVVLVINGRAARVTPYLRYVLTNICSIVPREILDQVVVVFTRVDSLDELEFEPESLTEFFGKPIPEERQFCLDNPYAKVANLIEKGIVWLTSSRLKAVAHHFLLMKGLLTELYANIYAFPSVGTYAFTQLYETKQEIDKIAKFLNAKLENLNDDKRRAEELKAKLSNTETAMAAVKDFETQKPVTYWDFEETPGRHHMICNQCKSNCHMDCNIPIGLNTTVVFKECKCFQWRVPKEIRIESEKDRQTLLGNVQDIDWRLLAHETGYEMGSCLGICSKRNFEINGTLVRGDPETQWTTSLFSPWASNQKTTIDVVRWTPLPFSLTMNDWSNVEKGHAMLCKVCKHPLANHSYQTSYHVKKTKMETIIDASKSAEYARLSNDVEKQKSILNEVNAKLASLSDEQKHVQSELERNLQKFATLSTSPSYLALLSEQKTYLQLLRMNAEGRNATDTIIGLDEQIEMIDVMHTTCTSPDDDQRRRRRRPRRKTW